MKCLEDYINKIIYGDSLSVLRLMPCQVVQTCITSPPYWGLRDYGMAGQLGLEDTPEEYVAKVVEVFREVKRVLKDDGTLWLNLGDSYAGSWGNYGGQNRGNGSQREITKGSRSPSAQGDYLPPTARVPGLKPKDLVGIPWMVAFALRADGWYLRSDIIWSKPNPMPESVTDRPTKSHEYLFLLSKSRKYYYDNDAIREPAKSITTKMPDSWDTGPAVHGNKPGRSDNGRLQGKTDKQRGHGRRHAGFNDRWDAMSKDEQQMGGANKRSVWTVATKPFKEAHFATFPTKLIDPCIMAGSKPGDLILDPFMGSGTVALRAKESGREYVGVELNEEYIKMAKNRLRQRQLSLDSI